MSLNARQAEILKCVREQGFVSVENLVAHFGVTAQTIRRDINNLCDEGLLRRFHGGAGLPSSAENIAYDTRKVMHLDAKELIASMVARYIPDGATLFLNLGTTTEEVARRLTDHEGLRVITNNIHVAIALGRGIHSEVLISGGFIRSRDLGITGESTVDFVRQFRVDYGIIGVSSIEEDGTLRDFDYREVKVTEAIMEQSREVLLVADHSKFGRNALVRLGHLSDVDVLFTDQPPPSSMRDALASAGIKVLTPEDSIDLAVSAT